METSEEIVMRLNSAQCSDEEAVEMIKKFDELKRQHPKVKVETKSP